MNIRVLVPGLLILLFLTGPQPVSAQKLMNWEAMDEVNATLPEEVRVYHCAGHIDGDTITAWYSITSLESGRYTMLSLYSGKNMKPLSYLDQHSDMVLLTNGGYFGTNVSYSLLINDYKLYSSNASAVSREYNGQSTLYYPTRGAFGIGPDMQAEASWVYSTGSDTYAYPQPSPNTIAEAPKPRPGPAYPEGGSLWEVSEAIGGGPLLIRDSTIIQDFGPELMGTAFCYNKHPRTAIGVNDQGAIIQLIVDGRQTHSGGVSLPVLASILLELGCVDAVNLDGGGSSCIFAGEQLLNKPSDGSTRSIPTMVGIATCHNFSVSNAAVFSSEADLSSAVDFGKFGFEKSLPLNTGQKGNFTMDLDDPSQYRIDLPFNGALATVDASEMKFVLLIDGLRSDSLTIGLDKYAKTRFISLGSYQLGRINQVEISKVSGQGPVYLSGIRLLRLGGGLPDIDISDGSYNGTYIPGEEIYSAITAQSNNPYRKLVAYRLYELADGKYSLLEEESFEACESYQKGIYYHIEKNSDPIILLPTIFDAAGDSVSTRYTINQDNNPPLVGLTKDSEISAMLGKNLHFEVSVLPGSEKRPLSSLEIRKNPEQENELLSTFTLSGEGDTIEYDYPVNEGDIPGIYFFFQATDVAGIRGEYLLPVAVTSVASRENTPPGIYYRSDIHALVSRESELPRGMFSFTDIQGRKLLDLSSASASGSCLMLPALADGIYICHWVSGAEQKSLRFIVTAH